MKEGDSAKLHTQNHVIVNFLPNKITTRSYCRFIDFQRAQWKVNFRHFRFIPRNRLNSSVN